MPVAKSIKILSGGAMRALLVEAVPLFDRATGIKADVRFALTSVLKKEIEGGAVFDVALLPRPELDALARHGSIDAGTQTDITRSAVGLAVRAGAPKPDISTTEALKRTILAAKSIAFSRLGASGVHFAEVIERLGIADEIRRKAVIGDAYMGEIVVRGDAELAVQQISELMPVAGIDIVGPLPGELQKMSLFAAAIFTAAKNPAGGAKLVSFLAELGLAPILERKGLSSP
jgi:molybdate transport system substrate-binding protein